MILTAASRHWMQISVDACIPCLPNSSCSVIGMSFNQDFTHVRLLQTKVWHLMILISVYRFFTPCSWPCLWLISLHWSKLSLETSQFTMSNCMGPGIRYLCEESCHKLSNSTQLHVFQSFRSNMVRSMLRTTESKSLGCLNKYGPKYGPFSTSRVPRSCLFPRTSCALGPPKCLIWGAENIYRTRLPGFCVSNVLRISQDTCRRLEDCPGSSCRTGMAETWSLTLRSFSRNRHRHSMPAEHRTGHQSILPRLCESQAFPVSLPSVSKTPKPTRSQPHNKQLEKGKVESL